MCFQAKAESIIKAVLIPLNKMRLLRGNTGISWKLTGLYSFKQIYPLLSGVSVFSVVFTSSTGCHSLFWKQPSIFFFFTKLLLLSILRSLVAFVLSLHLNIIERSLNFELILMSLLVTPQPPGQRGYKVLNLCTQKVTIQEMYFMNIFLSTYPLLSLLLLFNFLPTSTNFIPYIDLPEIFQHLLLTLIYLRYSYIYS